ncbi:MAG: sortase, partial [Defluviitaleaceae bacterium]|nr:sortase [Defluviitaleaceae bacterium]
TSTTHFDPSRSDVAARDAPAMHFNNGSHNTTASHNYNYGDVIGRLTVERLGRTINVIGGATMRAMDFGAGHFSFTGLNTGNTGLIGHNRGNTNGFFSFVRGLREGDILTLEAGGIVRRYSVTMLFIVDDTDFSPLMQFGDNRLTLVTCVEYQRNRRRIAVAIALD